MPLKRRIRLHGVNTSLPAKSATEKLSGPATTAAATQPKDTVTISKQAVLMNSRDYSPAEEAQESSAEKAAEKLKGQRYKLR